MSANISCVAMSYTCVYNGVFPWSCFFIRSFSDLSFHKMNCTHLIIKWSVFSFLLDRWMVGYFTLTLHCPNLFCDDSWALSTVHHNTCYVPHKLLMGLSLLPLYFTVGKWNIEKKQKQIKPKQSKTTTNTTNKSSHEPKTWIAGFRAHNIFLLLLSVFSLESDQHFCRPVPDFSDWRGMRNTGFN